MKSFIVTTLVAGLAAGPAFAANDRADKQGAEQLNRALAAVASSADPRAPKAPDQFNPKSSNGQGAENANPAAILRVCSKDTPAAHRAAICQTGVSPD